MRALSAALAFAIAVLIVPLALRAQVSQRPFASPLPPSTPLPARPPHEPHVHPNRPAHGRHTPYGSVPVVVGPLDPYYATPAATPKNKPAVHRTPKPANAPEIFDEHSAAGG